MEQVSVHMFQFRMQRRILTIKIHMKNVVMRGTVSTKRTVDTQKKNDLNCSLMGQTCF